MALNPARDILIRAVMEASSGLPEDRVSNDFAFHAPADVADGGIIALAGLVDAFYNDDQANGHGLHEWISEFVDRGATHELQGYRIQADGSTGSPAVIEPWLGPIAPPVGNGMPTEVAAVLSFHAELTGVVEEVGGTRPRARRRGRLYIGPLVTGAVAFADPPYLLDATLLQTMRQAAATLVDASLGQWAVWSRVDATLRPVVGGWTDNAPDTQRRRGAQSSSRITWSV